MIWTKELIRNQNKDLTPYTDNQVDYLVQVLNTIVFPWTCLDIKNVQLKTEPGAFGDTYALYIDGLCYMTTSAPDLLDHRTIFEEASGDILLTGLGLGLGVLLANANQNVTSITIIENHPLIIKHIAPMVAKACGRIPMNLIEHDANTWVPNQQFDFAYIDHAYEKADETPYIPFCKQIISWWDERQELMKTWQ
jgi:hypothetical protein